MAVRIVLKTVDPRFPPMPGWRASGFRRPGKQYVFISVVVVVAVAVAVVGVCCCCWSSYRGHSFCCFSCFNTSQNVFFSFSRQVAALGAVAALLPGLAGGDVGSAT